MAGRTTRPGEAARIPVEQAIALRFKFLDEFNDELAANISTGGVFIRTPRPHPVASVFEFQLPLDDDLPLIAGKAQVAWIRRRDDAEDRPAGMGAQFVELDDESRRILQEMANGYELQADDSSREEQAEEDAEAPLAEEETTAPVELVDPATRERPAPTGPVTTAARPPTVARAQQASPAPSWRIWVLSAAGLGAALGAGLWLGSATNEPAIPVAEMPRSEAPPEPEPAEPTAPVVAEPDETDLVHEWARAWSEQRVDDYLATYSARFEPPRGLHRTAWEERRRQRLLAPQRIQVTLASIEVEKLSDDSSRVRFVQEYESDKYHDVVRKILDLELVEGGWKILRESTE